MPTYAIFLAILYSFIIVVMTAGFLAYLIPSTINNIKTLHKNWKRRHLKIVKPVDNVIYIKDRNEG